MRAQQVIEYTQSLGIQLATNDGRLVVDSPVGVLNDDLKGTLLTHKAEIISLLQHNSASKQIAIRVRVYEVILDGKPITVIDRHADTYEDFVLEMNARFGANRISNIVCKKRTAMLARVNY